MRQMKASEWKQIIINDIQAEEVLVIFDGMIKGNDNLGLIEGIREGFIEDYIPLPGKCDINEYCMMEE